MNFTKIVIEYFTSTHGIISTVLSCISFICMSCSVCWSLYWTNKMNKDVEKYKHQLQVKVLKTELKIKQLSSIYPELFLRYKRAEYMVNSLCNEKEKNETISTAKIDQTRLLINDAVNYMVQNLLFISKEIEKCSDEWMVWVNEFETTITEAPVNLIQTYKYKERQLIDNMQKQMQKELGNEV